ncbi:MAG: serpin family protein [Planctomycetes bacterium]|nr:serpin family protein [Planctomycetota bacterium]
MLAHLYGKEPGANHFISPYSIQTCLTMVRNGAAADTKAELDKALNLTGNTDEDVQAGARALREVFAGDNGVTLETANALWSHKTTPFKAAFVDQQKDIFGAEVSSLDFSSPETLEKINGWCNEKTHGKIPKILEEIRPDLLMVLANAIYFKGTWEDEFDKKLTKKEDFTTPDGKVVQADFMRRSDSVQGLERDDLMAISLPYKGGKTSMLLMLPAKGADMAKFVAGMTPEFVATVRSELRHKNDNASISFPKFKVERTYDLIPAFQEAGVKQAFTPSANFSLMGDVKPLFIGFIIHKTFVEVNEEGTEAAAVTATGMCGGAAPRPQKPFVFKADRPFAYAIIHNDTGAVMFQGILNDPTAK